MKKFFSKLWVRITAISLAIVLFLFSMLLLVNSFAPYNPKCYHLFGYSGIFGSIDRAGSPSTYYQGEKTSNVIEFIDLRPDNRDISYVWINVSDMQEDADIYLYNGTDTTEKTNINLLSKTTLTGKDLKKDKDGWICIYDNSEKTKYHSGVRFYIGSMSKMRIREVIFIHETGGIVAFNIKGIVRRGNAGSETISKEDHLYENFDFNTYNSSENYTATFTPEMKKRINSLTNLNDEQSTFDAKKVK